MVEIKYRIAPKPLSSLPGAATNTAPATARTRVTTLMWFGVIRLSTRRRLIAVEIFRSNQ